MRLRGGETPAVDRELREIQEAIAGSVSTAMHAGPTPNVLAPPQTNKQRLLEQVPEVTC